jgi:hypothetical protein
LDNLVHVHDTEFVRSVGLRTHEGVRGEERSGGADYGDDSE